jgi:hypothetical protein
MPNLTQAPSPTKCSKPAGEYCRLHNPKQQGNKFSSAQEVFNKVFNKGVEKKTKIKPNSELRFQTHEQTRTLPDDIPQDLTAHIAQNKLQLQHLTHEEKIALSGYTGFAAGICNTVLLGVTYNYYGEAPLWRESGKGPCDFLNRKDLVDYMKTMDGLLSKRQAESRIVYRGTPIYEPLHKEIEAVIGKKLIANDTDGLIKGLEEYYKVGKTFNYSSYLSTTHSAHYAAERTENEAETRNVGYGSAPEIKGIMFELKTNAGLDVTSAARTHNAYEREVVLPRDTHFKVVSVSARPTSYDTVSGFDHEPTILEKKSYEKIAIVVQMVEVDKQGNEIAHVKPHVPRRPIEKLVAS